MKAKPASAVRDSAQTRQKILTAVEELIAEGGFRDVGINAVARRAGVDKVLIYRYFGGLPELLKAYAEESDFWPRNEQLQDAAVTGLPAQARQQLIAFSRELRKRPLTQEVMRWELMENNELTKALARHREQQGNQLFDALEQLSSVDVRAVGSLLSAGLTYLILRSKTADVYNGLHLDSSRDWERIEQAAGQLVELALSTPAPRPPAASGQHKEPASAARLRRRRP